MGRCVSGRDHCGVTSVSRVAVYGQGPRSAYVCRKSVPSRTRPLRGVVRGSGPIEVRLWTGSSGRHGGDAKGDGGKFFLAEKKGRAVVLGQRDVT